MAGDGARVPDVSEQRAGWPSVEMVRCCDVGDLLHGHRCGYAGTNEIACPNHIPCPGETYVALSDPASVLAALLAESPEATVAAIEALLMGEEAIEATGDAMDDWLFRIHGVISSARPQKDGEAATVIGAAVRSLLSKAPKGDG